MTETPYEFLSAEEWKEKAFNGGEPELPLRKQFSPEEIREPDDDSRTLEFIISTSSLDRDNDTISSEGWQLANYRKNPVVLFAHNYRALPVARATKIKAEEGKLMATAEFASPEVYEFAETVYQMYRGGFLRATSVGFKPKKWARVEDENRPMGIDFEQQELLEFSAVPVPANPEAVIQARSAGIDTEPYREWIEQALDTWYEKDSQTGVWIPREKLEEIYRMLSPSPHPAAHSGEQVLPVTYEHNVRAASDALSSDGEQKGPTSFKDLPLAPRGRQWDAAAATARVRNWADAQDGPNARYGRAFLWIDSQNSGNFGAYKLPVGDILDGQLRAVPRGVFAAAAVMQGARGGPTSIPESDRPRIRSHIARYYSKMRSQWGDDSIVPPWESEQGRTYELLNSLEAEGKATVDLLELRDDLERRLFPDLFEEEKEEGGEGGENSDDGEIDFSDPKVAEIISEAVREEVRRLTGRV